MRRGLELRLQKLERSGNQLPSSAICIIGTDKADCERQLQKKLQELPATRPMGFRPILMICGSQPCSDAEGDAVPTALAN